MKTYSIENCKVLDRVGAMRTLGIDPSSYEMLIGIMRKELGEWTDLFTAAVGGGRETMRVKAHRLKSDAANVGATCVSAYAAALETAVMEKQSDDVVENYRSKLVCALWELTEELG